MKGRKGKGGGRPLFPRSGQVRPLPAFETPSKAMVRLQRERRIATDAALSEKESRRLAEVKAAFFEGMAAGYDRSWLERPPDDYWLESDARRDLYAGPPLPLDPHLRLKAGRGRRGYSHDPQRDPGRVVGDSFAPAGPRKPPRKGKPR